MNVILIFASLLRIENSKKRGAWWWIVCGGGSLQEHIQLTQIFDTLFSRPQQWFYEKKKKVYLILFSLVAMVGFFSYFVKIDIAQQQHVAVVFIAQWNYNELYGIKRSFCNYNKMVRMLEHKI